MDAHKVKSGIPGLDRMTGGGFVKNSVIALAGGTGSGRTIFASQFLVKGATDYGEPGLFLSFDEQKESIYPRLPYFHLVQERKNHVNWYTRKEQISSGTPHSAVPDERTN